MSETNMTVPLPQNGESWTYCPVEDLVDVVGGKWKPSILLQLKFATRRFNELHRLLGSCSSRMLALHLKELERDLLVQRTVIEEVPPHVEYSLTALGDSLMPVLDAMAQWGLRHGRRRDSVRQPLPDLSFAPSNGVGSIQPTPRD